MKILVACEFSQVVTEAFTKAGHYAMSCDLLPAEKNYPHYQGDVMDILNDGWDMMIAHPPCTYLTNAGVRHLHSVQSRNGKLPKIHGEARWEEMRKAAAFFRLLLEAPIKKIAIENPIPHRYAVQEIGLKYNQIIQPWMFGHGETKATCLWLKNLPPLVPTNIVEGREARIHRMPPGPNRWKERSRTFEGIANAMAKQWAK